MLCSRSAGLRAGLSRAVSRIARGLATPSRRLLRGRAICTDNMGRAHIYGWRGSRSSARKRRAPIETRAPGPSPSAAHEARYIREAIAGVNRARQLDQGTVLAIVPACREQRGASRLRTEELRLPLVERDGLDALLDACDPHAIRPLEHGGDRSVDSLEVALEIRQSSVEIRGRHAKRRWCIGDRSQAVDAQPGAAHATLELLGQWRLADDSLRRQNLDARVVRILQQIADRIRGLTVARRRRPRDDLRADAAPPRDQPDVAELAQRFANGGAANLILLAELHLRGQQAADGVNAAADVVDELIRNLLIPRPVRGASTLRAPAPSGTAISCGWPASAALVARRRRHAEARSWCRIFDRNSRARSLCGSAKKACVSRFSTIRPRSMKIMRCAT